MQKQKTLYEKVSKLLTNTIYFNIFGTFKLAIETLTVYTQGVVENGKAVLQS